MIQFYAPDIESSLRLGPEEAAHCVKVLRKRTGDLIIVTDGKGYRYVCEILDVDKRHVELKILTKERIEKTWPCRITIVVAPTKNADRMAWLVEKAVEIGVDRIVFVKCRYSERKSVNIERLRRNAVSAMNQSLKTVLPDIEEAQSFAEILTFEGDKYFGYCDGKTERKTFVKEYKAQSDVVIAIGPEGDFDKEEVERMIKAGYQPVTFGEERLRTETAPLYGLTAVHVINDLKI